MITATDYLARHMIGLLWYISGYADFDDYSVTTRRDFFADCIEEFHEELTEEGRSEVLGILRSHKGHFGPHPYGPRFDRFLDRFTDMLHTRGDPALLIADGAEFRKKKKA